MGILKLNETPVRTSRNFNINNIKLDDVEIPENIGSFDNVEIINSTSEITVEKSNNNFNLTYGIGDILVKKVKEEANQNLKLVINNKNDDVTKLNFKFDNQNFNLFENIEIIANENSKSTVILKYESNENTKCFHNGVIRILAKENSVLHVIIANFMNSVSNNFMSIENSIESNANVKYTIVDFGGKNSITNYYSNLIGDFSENTINAIYLGNENEVIDLNYIGELRGEKSNIDIKAIGALNQNAKKNFKGTIDFKKGCKKAKGNEEEFCMLLSDKAKSIALPMLLCSEEDVEGSHSSSAGKAEEKELFYIMSRGFSLKEAIKLIIRAKFNKTIENIQDKELRRQVLNEMDKKLD